MHHVIPIEPGTAACVIAAIGFIATTTCAIGAAVYWRRAGARRTALTDWTAEQTRITITDGDTLFDRWNEAAERVLSVRRAQAATVLWGVGGAIHAGLAAIAETICR